MREELYLMQRRFDVIFIVLIVANLSFSWFIKVTEAVYPFPNYM